MNARAVQLRRPLNASHCSIFLGVLLLACGAPAPEGDPCAPGGHAHRGSTEEDTWCHCFAGYRSSADGLACEVDPDAAGPDEYPFEEAIPDACSLAAGGPFASVTAAEPPPAVNAFDTTYTVALTAGPDGHSGSVRYDPYASGKVLLFLSSDAPLEVREGLLTTPLTRGPAPTCEPFSAVHGVNLLEDVGYTLHFGPTPEPSIQLLVRPVP